jgi:hypothetical protein
MSWRHKGSIRLDGNRCFRMALVVSNNDSRDEIVHSTAHHVCRANMHHPEFNPGCPWLKCAGSNLFSAKTT